MIIVINFIDGIDGFAVGIIIIFGIILFFVVLMNLSIILIVRVLIYMAAVLVGVFFVFLIFNCYLVKIFMGDSGVIFLGFVLGIIVVEGIFKVVMVVLLIVFILIFGFFIFDNFFVIFKRIKEGKFIY